MKKKIIASVLSLSILGTATSTSAMVAYDEPAYETPTVSKVGSFQEKDNQTTVEEKTSKLADQIIETGMSLIGVAQYANPGEQSDEELLFRCASFISYIFKQNGIDLKTKDEDKMYEMGTKVKKSELQRGDLIFLDGNHNGYIEHVGIYIGDNKMLHMVSHKSDVAVTDLSRKYYQEGYYGAVRIIPNYVK